MFLGKKSELTQVKNEKVIVANGSIPTTENYQSTVEQCRRMPTNTTEEPCNVAQKPLNDAKYFKMEHSECIVQYQQLQLSYSHYSVYTINGDIMYTE